MQEKEDVVMEVRCLEGMEGELREGPQGEEVLGRKGRLEEGIEREEMGILGVGGQGVLALVGNGEIGP